MSKNSRWRFRAVHCLFLLLTLSLTLGAAMLTDFTGEPRSSRRVLKPTDQWVPSTHSRPPTNKIF
jgi:hypothetical protein